MPQLEYIQPRWSRAKEGGRWGLHVWKDMGRGWPLLSPSQGHHGHSRMWPRGSQLPSLSGKESLTFETSLGLQFLFQKHGL